MSPRHADSISDGHQFGKMARVDGENPAKKVDAGVIPKVTSVRENS